MKKILFLVGYNFIFLISVYGQENTRNLNPLAEARFNFFKHTVLIFNEYLDTDNGSYNTTVARVLHPVGNRKWNLRADIPLVSTNTSSINKTGLGDISFGASYIPYVKNKTGIGIRGKITTNSAVNTSFGSGKWIFTPTFFLGNYLGNKKEFLLLSSFENQISFAGSNSRNKVNTTVLENTILYFFNKNWVGADVALRYNATIEGFQNSTFIEFGRKFTPDSMFYIHPSVGFGSKKAYNYGMELGLVVLF
jgi:hypothetical protein